MRFAGWSLAELAVLFGAAGAAITGLYLLRMRRRQVVVPFAELWEQLDRETDTRKLWRRLRRLFSWLVQMLLLLLLCLALGDPRPQWWFSEPRTVAVIVDVSASMDAPAGDDGMLRLDAARARVEAELAALGHRDRVVVIAAGPEPRVVVPLSDADARGGQAADGLQGPGQALATLTPRPGRADMDAALTLARNAVAGYPAPELLVVTDGALAPDDARAVAACATGPLACRVAQVGARAATQTDDDAGGPIDDSADNLAITAFAARRYPGDRQKVEVLAEIRNLGATPRDFVFDVLADGVSVGKKQLHLEAGARTRELLPELDAARARLEAKLLPVEGGAALPGTAMDDTAWAVVPPLDPIDVTLVSDGSDLFLEAALLALDDHVRLGAVGTDLDAAAREALEDADLVIFDVADAPLPDPLPGTHLVVFDPHRLEDSPFEQILPKKQDLRRPRLTEQDRKHPILDGVVFKDVNMSRGTSFQTEATDLALVKHLGEPMVVLRERPERAVLAIGFDPRQSDLPLRVAFPLLVANVVDYFEARQPGFVATIPAGTSRELTYAQLGLGRATGVTSLQVTAPDGTQRVLRARDGRFRLLADDTGIVHLEVLDGDAAGAGVDLAVNLADAQVSDLRPRLPELPEDADASAPPPPAPPTDGPLWTMLLGICLIILAAEWTTYHRRRTV